MESVEHITSNGKPVAYIMRAGMKPEKTTFLTPSYLSLQVGFVVYPAGGEIARHTHLPLERHILGAPEVLIVQKGCCEIDIYDDSREFVTTRLLQTGDVILLASGGHGLRMLEDTILLEIKQGPYTGLEEKERF